MLYKYIYTHSDKSKRQKYISIYIYIYVVIFLLPTSGAERGGGIKDAISLLVFFETRRKRGRERKQNLVCRVFYWYFCNLRRACMITPNKNPSNPVWRKVGGSEPSTSFFPPSRAAKVRLGLTSAWSCFVPYSTFMPLLLFVSSRLPFACVHASRSTT